MPADASAQQGMYRCKSPTGTWEFLDRPCPDNSKLLSAPPPVPELRWPIKVTPLRNSEVDWEADAARAAAADAAARAAAEADFWGSWPYPGIPRRRR